jgi:hypothetical protein
VQKDGQFWTDFSDQMVVMYKETNVEWLLPKLYTLLLEYLCFEHFFLLCTLEQESDCEDGRRLKMNKLWGMAMRDGLICLSNSCY